MSKKQVVIVIPLAGNQNGFSESEKLSLIHLEHFLPNYDKYFLAPHGLNISCGRIPILHFDDQFFGSVQAHNKLVLSDLFYDRFSEYEYIMMHHLDCLVFRNNLSEWCEKGYDFIGSPWIKGPNLPKLKKEGVGNGGLALKKVEAFQRLLNSKVKWRKFRSEMKYIKMKKSSIRKTIISLYKSVGLGHTIRDHIENYIDMKGAEDRFLYKYAKIYDPEFHVAPVEEALKFGFETNPKICFERNNRELPFGVHRWERYDKKFWEPYLLQELI